MKNSIMAAFLLLKLDPDILDPCCRSDKKARLLESLAVPGQWQWMNVMKLQWLIVVIAKFKYLVVMELTYDRLV